MTINDRFTKLKLSKQRKWQLRRLKKGMCILCGEPLATATYCLKHAVATREASRKRRGSKKKYQSLTRRLEAGKK